ncbi:MAG: hypothetical protein WC588_02685 [Candidatus Micrarchaeia archaeon]
MGSGDGEMPDGGFQGDSQESGPKGPKSEKEETSFHGKGERPDFRVVQAEYDQRLGKAVFNDIGAMWKNRSKAGNDFYTLKIGKLRLLVFKNEK